MSRLDKTTYINRKSHHLLLPVYLSISNADIQRLDKALISYRLISVYAWQVKAVTLALGIKCLVRNKPASTNVLPLKRGVGGVYVS